MTLPASWTQIPVICSYTNRDGDPASGYVTFDSQQQVVIGGVVIVPKTITMRLDGNGQISGTLPSTNDPDLSVTGWTYTVTEHIRDGRAPFTIEVPYTETQIDLATYPIATTNLQSPVQTGIYATDVGVTVASQAAVENAQTTAENAQNTADAAQSAADGLRSDLANSASGKGPDLVQVDGSFTLRQWIANLLTSAGAALVGFAQSGSGAVPRNLRDKVRNVAISVEDFGAVGDGVTNDYAAILAAIAEAQSRGPGTVVNFENANYALGSVLVMQNVPVILRGKGGKHPAYNGAPAATGTSLKYTGAAATGTYFVTVQHVTGLHGLQGISLDCDSKVRGLDIADAYYGEYRDVSIRNMASGTVAMRTGMSALGATNWNTFDRFSIDAIGAGGKGLHVTGTGVQNTAHNVFRDLQINYSGGATGLHLGYSDNNSFHMVFVNRIDGVAGNGVYADPSEDPAFPEGNYFYHLQAGQDGWQQPNNTPRNYIYGYDRSNGQPLPSLGATNSLLFFTEGANLWMGTQKFVKDDDAWSTYTPAVSAGAGTITTLGTVAGRYLVRGKLVKFHVNVPITTNGTGASWINVGLPVQPGGSSGFRYMANGRMVGGASTQVQGTITQGNSTMTVVTATAGYPGADGVTVCVSGEYEIN